MDDPPSLKRSHGSWLREEDELFYEQDAEQHKEQAERNATMRERLLARKRQKEAEPIEEQKVPFEEFMQVKAVGTKTGVEDGMPPWFVMRPHIENTVLRLHEEMLDFMNFMSHTKEEVRARRAWVQTITDACRSLWPSCKVRVFGSFFTGLSLPNGDVDMAVTDVPGKPANAMKMLVEHLLAAGEISWLEIIESAKVPVAKMRSQSCGLRADVVFNQPDGIETSKFIKERMKEYPQMKPLLVFLKYFLLQRGLHETYGGGMGSYLLCNVVLHFLQRHPARRDKRIYAATSLGHYLFDFLKYYGQEFKYETTAVSVVNGGRSFPISERSSGKGKGKGKDKGKGKGKLSLCLESPSNADIDLGGAAFRMAVLRNLFHHGFHCLCHLMVSKSSPETSMICPLLLDPLHPVITDRYKLMSEQPVALPGLPRAADRAAEEAFDAVVTAVGADDNEDEQGGEPLRKKSKKAQPEERADDLAEPSEKLVEEEDVDDEAALLSWIED